MGSNPDTSLTHLKAILSCYNVKVTSVWLIWAEGFSCTFNSFKSYLVNLVVVNLLLLFFVLLGTPKERFFVSVSLFQISVKDSNDINSFKSSHYFSCLKGLDEKKDIF